MYTESNERSGDLILEAAQINGGDKVRILGATFVGLSASDDEFVTRFLGAGTTIETMFPGNKARALMSQAISPHDMPANRADIISETWASPAYQAFQILHIGFAVAPIIAGLDKFFHVLTNWDNYVAPW